MRPEEIIMKKPTPQPAAASVPGGERRETCSAHSPLPWHISEDYRDEICAESGELLMWLVMNDGTKAEANAAYIVQACNSYPKLVEALKFAKEIIDDQADRFHQDCRCQLCESCPQLIDAALREAGEL